MPRVTRIPATGYNTLPNFMIQSTRAVKAMIGHTILAADHSGSSDLELLAADDYGDRIIRPGTVVAAFRPGGSGTGLVYRDTFYPLTTAAAVATNFASSLAAKLAQVRGIVIEQVNLRDGERISSILVDGWVDENWIYFIDGVKTKKPSDVVLAVMKDDIPEVKFDANVGVLETNS